MSDILNPYWTSAFGIPDEATFDSVTHPFWTAVFPVDPFGLLEKSAANYAAEFPFGGLGVAAQTYLTLHPYQSTDQSTAGNAGVNSAIVSAQGAQSEARVPQLVIPNCFQCTIQMVAGGHAVENVIGVQNAGGTAAGAAAAVLAAWKVASGPLVNLSSLITMVGVRAVDISSTNGQIVFVADTTAGGKTTTNSLATRGACALIQWNGGTRSRSSRGRLYYGPLMEQDIQTDGATMDGTRGPLIATGIANFRTSLSGAGYPLVVLSRALTEAFAVTSSALEQTVATQRRRIR